MTSRISNIAAFFLLATMFILMFFSMRQDALTFDELAHIPAGYSYLTQRDYRVNPEHPPLAKDLSAVPLLFQDLHFPAQSQNWRQDASAPPWWVQFDLGTEFLYKSGNDPRAIITWARLPMILLTLVLAWLVFWWTRRLAGPAAALGALTLFAFSPTFLAHGRLVTTDVAAAFGALAASYFWILFLKRPSPKNVFMAGIAFGTALLFKFSLVLLVPCFVFLTLSYIFLFPHARNIKAAARYGVLALASGLIGVFFVISPVYQFHIARYPVERQLRDTAADLAPHPVPLVKDATLWMTEQPLLRPLAQYARGVLMASQRTVFGNTVYFLGEISGSGWRHYFPVVYFFKLPLAVHMLSAGAVMLLLWTGFRQRSMRVVRDNFVVFAFLLWIAVYWAAALGGSLNIGVRHLLPVLPFVFILTALALAHIFKTFSRQRKLIAGGSGVLFIWYVVSSLSAFPHYISYYNEAAGGVKNGWKVAVDSNYDWGQDFYRLFEFVEANSVQKIRLDYFGGENPEYWLGERYEKLDPFNPPDSGWVAVSLNQLMGGIARPVEGFDQPSGYYKWLEPYTPVARAGTSILIYYIE